MRLAGHHERPAGTLRQALHFFDLSMAARDRMLEIMSLNDVG